MQIIELPELGGKNYRHNSKLMHQIQRCREIDLAAKEASETLCLTVRGRKRSRLQVTFVKREMQN